MKSQQIVSVQIIAHSSSTLPKAYQELNRVIDFPPQIPFLNSLFLFST